MTHWKTLVDKFEPIDIMILAAMIIIATLIGYGKDGILIGTFQTLIGALIRGFVKK